MADELVVGAVDNVSGPLERMERKLQEVAGSSQTVAREIQAAFRALGGGDLNQHAAMLERVIGLYASMEQRINAAANAQQRLAAEGKRATPFPQTVAKVQQQTVAGGQNLVDALVKHNQLGGLDEATVRRLIADAAVRATSGYAQTKLPVLTERFGALPDASQRFGTTADLAKLSLPRNMPADSPYAKAYQSELNVALIREANAAKRGAEVAEQGVALAEAANRALETDAAAKRRRTIADKRIADITNTLPSAAAQPLTATGGSGGGQRPPRPPVQPAAPDPEPPKRRPNILPPVPSEAAAAAATAAAQSTNGEFQLTDQAMRSVRQAMAATSKQYDELAQHLQALNRETFDQSIASGRFKNLSRQPGRELAVDLQTGQYVSRNQGVLRPGVAEDDSLLRQARALDRANWDKQIEAGNKVIRAEENLAAQEDNAAQLVSRNNAKRVADQRAAVDRAEQRAEFARQQGRVNAGDPFVARVSGGFLDTGGDKPTFQRIVNRDRVEPGTDADLAVALRRKAEIDAGRKTADEAEQRLNDARVRFAAQQERLLREASLPVDQRTLHQSGSHLVDTTNPNDPRVFRFNERQATSEELLGAERDAALKTRQISAARAQLAGEEKALAVSEREFQALLQEQNKRGILNNFLTGISNSGFGGGPSFSGRFDGLARSAGQAVKYNALYSVMGALQQAAAGATQEFLNMDDSITELEVVMGEAAANSADFSNALQDVASLGGFNVGEAMDVAARGVRAFRTELETANQAMVAAGTSSQTLDEAQQQFGRDFAQEASRLAVLSTTTLSDSAGNLTAIAKGYQLPTQGAGLRQVTDAVAGAKLVGGGDETQIFQGLANSAVLFKEMGFSLREAATIISALNAETDQSGQLLATRVSRLAQILQGESGKKFLNDINQTRPSGTTAVDTTADAKTQMLQLSEMYQKMDASQRQVLSSRLGGTSQAREILILLDKLSGEKGILAKAGDTATFDNAGLREFERRLTNVRAQLTVILGNVRALVTNLAASGLADPFVALVGIVKNLTTALKEASQVVLSLASAFRPFTSIAVNLLALGGALKVISSIRNAGGVGNALLALEGRVAPTRTLARMQLGNQSPGDQLASGGLVDSYYLRSIARSDAASKIITGTAGDEKVAEAAKKLRASANDLQRAEEELRAIPIGAPNRPEAQQRVRDARGVVGDDTLALEREQRLQAARARANYAIDEKRDAATDKRNKDLAPVTAERELVARQMADLEKAGDTTSRAYSRLQDRNAFLMEREEAIRAAFNRRLEALDAERLIAEGKAVRTSELGSLSFLGRERALINEKGGGFRGALRAGGAALKADAAALGSGALDAVGGPAGAAILAGVAALAAFGAAKSAMEKLGNAQTDALKAIANPLEMSATALSQNATTLEAAADNLRESSDGIGGRFAALFATTPTIDPKTGQKTGGGLQENWISQTWGGVLDTFLPRNPEIEREITNLRLVANDQKAVAERLAAAKTDAINSGSAGQIGAALDFSGVDALTGSIKTLSDNGYRAAEIFGALRESITAFNTEGTGSLTLSKTQITKVGENLRLAGDQAFETVRGKLATTASRVQPGPLGLPTSESFTAQQGLDALNNSSPTFFGAQAAKAAREVASLPNIDLNSQYARDKFKEILTENLKAASIPEETAKMFADEIAGNLSVAADALRKDLASPENLRSFVFGGLSATSQLAGAEAGSASRRKQLTTGGAVDTSAVDNATAALDTFKTGAAEARSAIERALAAGDIQPDEAARMIADLQRQEDDLFIKRLDALAAGAKALAADDDKKRTVEQRAAGTDAQVRAIGDKYFKKDLDAALASHDVEAITTILDKGSRQQVDSYEAILQQRLKDAKAKDQNRPAQIAAAKKALQDAKDMKTTLDKIAPDTPAATQAAKDVADAQVALDKLLRGGGSAEEIQAQINAYREAKKRANPTDTYGGARDALGGINGADRELTRQQANATSSRNELELSRIALDKSKIQLADAAATQGGKNSEAYRQALIRYYEAVNAYNDKLLEVADIHRRASIDLSDPVAVAANDVKAARDKLAQDKKNNASQSQLDRDTVELHQKQNAEEASIHSRRMTDAQNAQQLGRISQSEYLRMLEAERNRIKTLLAGTKQGTNMYQQLKDELVDSELKIKQAANEMSGQFNLGDIKVPTVYEVRRAIANAQASTSTVNQAVIANTTNNTITINGADLAMVEGVLKKYLASAPRYTPSGRKA